VVAATVCAYEVRQWLNLRTEMQDVNFLARRFRAEPFFLTGGGSSLLPLPRELPEADAAAAAAALVEGGS